MEGPLDVPFVVKRRYIMGYSLGITLYRIGNLVIANDTVSLTSLNVRDSQLIDETMPSGFRPSSRIYPSDLGAYMVAVPAVGNTHISWKVLPDGKMYFSSTGASGSFRSIVFGIWITDDAWPS